MKELLLAFDTQSTLRDGSATMRVMRSIAEHFRPWPPPETLPRVTLPSAFRETVLMDDGGWRRRPRDAGAAASMGERMWSEISQYIGADLASELPEIVRLGIVSGSSGVDDVPWEWLNAGPDFELAANSRLRLVRYQPARFVAPPMTLGLPLKVLVVLTNPKDERLLQSWVELPIITGPLKPPHFEQRVLSEPRRDALQAALRWSPHIVHYVGHAGIQSGTGNIILHDEREGTWWLNAATFARSLPSSVRLLCLSTCVTAENYQVGGLVRFAHSPPDVELPTTIVNQYAIEPEAARLFWATFYPRLLEHQGDVVEAFHSARMAVHDHGPRSSYSWASFSLVVRNGSDLPFRLGTTRASRAKAEIQAEWSARLVNGMAVRLEKQGETGQVARLKLDEETKHMQSLVESISESE